jgi:hypothetical protein
VRYDKNLERDSSGHMYRIPSMTEGTPGQWMDPDQAKLTPYTWTASQIAAFKKEAVAAGYLKPDATFNDIASLYADLVNEASKYGAVGRKITPDQIMSMYPNGAATGSGAQGPQSLGETDARSALESAMQSEIGQGIASPDDVASFQSAAQAQMASANKGNSSFSPGEYAVEWVRSHYASKARQNRALGFYNTALSFLGGGGVPRGEINTNVSAGG